MSKRLLTCVVALVVAVVLAWIAIWSGTDRPSNKAWPQTERLICCVLDNYDELQGTDPHRANSVLTSQLDSLAINKALLSLMLAKGNSFRPLTGFNLSNGVFRDGWGTPLLFALTNNVTNSGLVPLLTHRPFVVWSAGPNLINEYGSGDDVVVTGR
jgi:hypothetical protein